MQRIEPILIHRALSFCAPSVEEQPRETRGSSINTRPGAASSSAAHRHPLRFLPLRRHGDSDRKVEGKFRQASACALTQIANHNHRRSFAARDPSFAPNAVGMAGRAALSVMIAANIC
jgi:hypothetical protein